MGQWPLLGGCVFSGLMNRHAVTGSSELLGPCGGDLIGKGGSVGAMHRGHVCGAGCFMCFMGA